MGTRRDVGSIGLKELVVLLGHWDQEPGPLYRQLATALRKLFEVGRYEAGIRLPPERALARTLAVSRNTVAAAYGQLREEGWVQSRQGSATVVAIASDLPGAAHIESGLFATLMKSNPSIVDLTVAVPRVAPIVEEIVLNPSRFLDPIEMLAGHGLNAHGIGELRQAVADKFCDEGLQTTADEILITSGAQQAISLTVRAMIRPGDAVAVDEFTFPGAIDAISASKGVLAPVKHGGQGTDLDDLVRVINEKKPRLLYTVPTFHNPTGVLIDGRDRERLAEIIGESGITVIDDLTLADLPVRVKHTPLSLAALAPGASVISVGSVSKVFWAGLRVGWIRASEPTIAVLASHKVSYDLASSGPSQMIALAALKHLEETKEWRVSELRRSIELLGNEMAERLPEWTWSSPAGGPYAWLRLPGADASEFSQLALRRGVGIVPASMLSTRPGTATDHIRLPLYPTAEELSTGIAKLEPIWKEYTRRLNPVSMFD